MKSLKEACFGAMMAFLIVSPLAPEFAAMFWTATAAWIIAVIFADM